MVAFTITPLTDHTGAEVVGLDFTRPIDTETRASLCRAFAERHVLVFRDQHFSPEEFQSRRAGVWRTTATRQEGEPRSGPPRRVRHLQRRDCERQAHYP